MSEAMKELLAAHLRTQLVRRNKEVEATANLSALNAQLIWTHGQQLPKEKIQELSANLIGQLIDKAV